MNLLRIASAAAVVGLVLALGACGGSTPPPPPTVARATYEADIKPLVKKLCFDCHGPDSPTMEEFDKNKAKYKEKDTGPRYDTYENLMIVVNGSDLGALMRRLDDGTHTKDGKPGNMNENLGADAKERAANLTIFKRWVGGWTLKRANEVTEAERKAILAPRQ